MIWFDLGWFGLVQFGLVWFSLVWFSLVLFSLVWFGFPTVLGSVLFGLALFLLKKLLEAERSLRKGVQRRIILYSVIQLTKHTGIYLYYVKIICRYTVFCKSTYVCVLACFIFRQNHFPECCRILVVVLP